MTCHAQCRQTIDKPMARHLFLVSRHEARLYEYLLERFRDDGNVEVILDRRRGERRGRPHGQESDRRRSDRRTRREVDAELRIRSHVILTLPEDDPAAHY
jgi:hypothetical protein